MTENKTGLQPVSRPVERVHYFGGWIEGAKSPWCQGLADRQHILFSLLHCFLQFMMQKDVKMQKNGYFDHVTGCKAPIHWSIYTTTQNCKKLSKMCNIVRKGFEVHCIVPFVNLLGSISRFLPKATKKD